jgi:hypothetical protein
MLMSAWACAPLLLAVDPTLLGVFEPHRGGLGFVRNVSVMWLLIGVAALVGRTVQLFFIRDVQTGLVWCTKILTDPFHDLTLYYRSPLYLLRGETLDPISREHPI